MKYILFLIIALCSTHAIAEQKYPTRPYRVINLEQSQVGVVGGQILVMGDGEVFSVPCLRAKNGMYYIYEQDSYRAIRMSPEAVQSLSDELRELQFDNPIAQVKKGKK